MSGAAVGIPTSLTTGAIYTGTNMSKLSLGVNHSCGIVTSGRVICWGDSSYGQVGSGTTGFFYTPVAVSTTGGLTTSNAANLVAINETTCAILTSNKMRCWGRNDTSQTGDGTTTDPRLPPVTPVGDPSVAFSHIGRSHSHTMIAVVP